MKAIVFACFIALAFASLETLSIGQTCDKNEIFVVNTFTVTPFPVAPGKQISYSMSGTFRANIYTAVIAVRTSFNKGKWNYQYFDVDTSFSNGQVYTFTFTGTVGTASGEYLVEVYLEKKQGDAFSCWTYTYNI